MFEKELAEFHRKAEEKARREEQMDNLGSLENDLIEQLYQDAIKAGDYKRACAINQERKARREKDKIAAKKAQLEQLQAELAELEGEADE